MGCSDVKSKRLTATGSVVSGKQRLKAVHILGGEAAGTVAFHDGGSGGTVLLTLDAGIGTVEHILMPENGMLFETDIYATITDAAGVTAFYA